MVSRSEFEFGAFLVYSPSGQEQVSRNSRALRDAVKSDGTMMLGGTRQRVLPYLTEALKKRVIGSAIEDLFNCKPVLVPAPRSSLMVAGSLYPTKLLCDAMVRSGLGAETRMLLERVTAVPKAAFQKPQARPTVQQHYDSMRVNAELSAPEDILVVDDVVTRGTMNIGCVLRLMDVYPRASIRCFALIRTMTGVEIERVIDICRGVIYSGEKWGIRRP